MFGSRHGRSVRANPGGAHGAEFSRDDEPRRRAGGCVAAVVVVLVVGVGLAALAFAGVGVAFYLYATTAERGMAVPAAAPPELAPPPHEPAVPEPPAPQIRK